MDPLDYLTRIGYAGAIKPDAQTLRGLHLAHMRSVPFENLNIRMKRPILLNEEALWNKIVIQMRGGFCYELNGLFAWLLERLGFDVTYLNARVYNRQGRLGIDFDHLALLVKIPGQPGRWLADIGFGDSFQEPLDFEDRGEQVQGLRSYRLEQAPNGFVTWQKNYDGTWERHYFFDLQPHKFPEEYEPACIYHQTSPDSSFTRGSIISQATPEGRVSLEDGRLIRTRDGQRTEQPIADSAEYNKLLKQYFDITSSEEQFQDDR
ncbi:MAG TPA: arylamine N-acetyltransferase [Anaerolineales bacterium]|nr:arylamine N-acetyltransferase [Anaerolineales bacterium]